MPTLPSRRQPAQQPASPTFSQIIPFHHRSPSREMDAVRDRIFTRVSPAREERGERCSEAIRCEREEQGRSASVAFVQCALRCAFLVLLLLLSHPTRKPSFPAAWKSVRRCSVWEVIASRVRLGDRAATCTCTCTKYTEQTGLPLLTQHFQGKGLCVVCTLNRSSFVVITISTR